MLNREHKKSLKWHNYSGFIHARSDKRGNSMVNSLRNGQVNLRTFTLASRLQFLMDEVMIKTESYHDVLHIQETFKVNK